MTQAQLQAQLDAALPTDIIQLDAETFNFPITVSKDCTIMGSPGTTFDVSTISSPFGINITAENVSISDITVINQVDSGFYGIQTSLFKGSLDQVVVTANIGLLLANAQNASLSDVTATGGSIGIKLVDSQYISFDGCDTQGNSIGIDMAGSSSRIGSSYATQQINIAYLDPTLFLPFIMGANYNFDVDGTVFTFTPQFSTSLNDLITGLNALPGIPFVASLNPAGILFTSLNFVMDITDVNLFSTIYATILPALQGTPDYRLDRTHHITMVECDIHENAVGVRTLNVDNITFNNCRIYVNSNTGEP